MKQTMPTIPYNPIARRAFVAFSEKTDQAWLRFFLPKSFRHCSVHINDAVCWTSIEGLAGYMEIFTHEVSATFDLPQLLRQQGMIVIEADLRRDEKTKRMLFPAIFSCVELAKRVLGIRRPLIVTPGQLYRYLKKEAAR